MEECGHILRLAIHVQSIGNLKVSSGGVAWNKAGGGKEIKIAAKGECLSQGNRKTYGADRKSVV